MAVDPRAATDGVVATGMVTAPAWASWLGDLLGLALGLGRFWQFLRNRNSTKDSTP